MMRAGDPITDGANNVARVPVGARLGNVYVALSTDNLLILKGRNLKAVGVSAAVATIFVLIVYCFHASTSEHPPPGFFDEMTGKQVVLLCFYAVVAVLSVVGLAFALGLEYRVDGRHRTIERRRLINAFPKTWHKEDLAAAQLVAEVIVNSAAEAREGWRVQLVDSRGQVIQRICYQHAVVEGPENIGKVGRQIATLLDIPLVTKERGALK